MVLECAPSCHMYHRPMTWPTNMVLQCATNKSRMRVNNVEPQLLRKPVTESVVICRTTLSWNHHGCKLWRTHRLVATHMEMLCFGATISLRLAHVSRCNDIANQNHATIYSKMRVNDMEPLNPYNAFSVHLGKCIGV